MLPFCDGMPNLTRNDGGLRENLQKINFSDPSTWEASSTKPGFAVSRLFQQQRSYPKFGPPQPTNLKVSFEEAPAEHMVFLFGIFMLISMVIICTLFLMKMTKASSGGGGGASSAAMPSSTRGAAFGTILPSNYSMVFWMPKTVDFKRHYRNPSTTHHRRHSRPSLMLLLRSSFSCGANNETASKHQRARYAARGRSCVSVVSSSSLNPLLPPHSLTITPSPSSGSGGGGIVGCCSSSATSAAANGKSTTTIAPPPPPPYEEFEKAKKK